MKHNKIFSSEVVNKGKTLDKVLESSGGGDIEVIEAELVDNDGAIPGSNNNPFDSLTYYAKNNYNFSISTETAAKILKAIYEGKSIKIIYPFYKYRGTKNYGYQGASPASIISVIPTNYVFSDNTNLGAPFPIFHIVANATFGATSASVNSILHITNNQSTGNFYGRQREAFELAGLTIEDFYRKFLPDNPYFPAE